MRECGKTVCHRAKLPADPFNQIEAVRPHGSQRHPVDGRQHPGEPRLPGRILDDALAPPSWRRSTRGTCSSGVAAARWSSAATCISTRPVSIRPHDLEDRLEPTMLMNREVDVELVKPRQHPGHTVPVTYTAANAGCLSQTMNASRHTGILSPGRVRSIICARRSPFKKRAVAPTSG